MIRVEPKKSLNIDNNSLFHVRSFFSIDELALVVAHVSKQWQEEWKAHQNQTGFWKKIAGLIKLTIPEQEKSETNVHYCQRLRGLVIERIKVNKIAFSLSHLKVKLAYCIRTYNLGHLTSNTITILSPSNGTPEINLFQATIESRPLANRRRGRENLEQGKSYAFTLLSATSHYYDGNLETGYRSFIGTNVIPTCCFCHRSIKTGITLRESYRSQHYRLRAIFDAVVEGILKTRFSILEELVFRENPRKLLDPNQIQARF